MMDGTSVETNGTLFHINLPEMLESLEWEFSLLTLRAVETSSTAISTFCKKLTHTLNLFQASSSKMTSFAHPRQT